MQTCAAFVHAQGPLAHRFERHGARRRSDAMSISGIAPAPSRHQDDGLGMTSITFEVIARLSGSAIAAAISTQPS